jgi:alkanesulfonate monooxygenase SsuD/methylene tetrahydromethanopterin reductase-like flavin-dependent oxidoreductase (luciferase family)
VAEPAADVPDPGGMLRVEPHSARLRERIWWGAASNATSVWAAKLGTSLQSSTLKIDETGQSFHVQQADQILPYRAAWKEAGHSRDPRASVSRSIFALVDDHDHVWFGRGNQGEGQIGFIDAQTRSIFGRSYAAELDILSRNWRKTRR